MILHVQSKKSQALHIFQQAMSISPSFHCPAMHPAPLCIYSSQPIATLHVKSTVAQSQCCMQIGPPANCIVQQASEVSSEFGTPTHGGNTARPRFSVFSFALSWCSAEYWFREHKSEGCVSLSGRGLNTVWRLLYALLLAPPGSCKGCEHKCTIWSLYVLPNVLDQ